LIVSDGFETSYERFGEENLVFPSLTELNIHCKEEWGLSEESWDRFGWLFPNVEIFDHLYNDQIGRVNFDKILRQWENLRELRLTCKMPAFGISTECELQFLEVLELDELMDFDNSTMETIADCFPNLRYMNLQIETSDNALHDTPLDDSCLEHLRKLKKVEEVVLCGSVLNYRPEQRITPEAVAKYRSETGVDLVVDLYYN